jgi:Rab-like protein 2
MHRDIEINCEGVCVVVLQVTYKSLSRWYAEVRRFRPHIPVLVGANKIDAEPEVTRRQFAFPQRNNLPLYFVSASDGTNVVKVSE